MNPINLCMLFMTVLIVSINCSPFKVEDEFDNDFATNRDAYDDADSNRWGRGSMRGRGGGGRRFSGRNLEKSRDNDFREVSIGGEDEASEELAAKNSDFERDDNGRMKGRGADDDEEERPFMKEDDGVPDRYIKIKKAAQEDAISRSPSSPSEPPPPQEQSRQSTQTDDETANVEGSESDDGASGDSSSAPASPNEDDASNSSPPSTPADGQPEDDGSYPKERQEEYDDDNKREPRGDEPSGEPNVGGEGNNYSGGETNGVGGSDEDGSTTVSVTSDDREERNYDADSQQLNQQPDQEAQPAEPEE